MLHNAVFSFGHLSHPEFCPPEVIITKLDGHAKGGGALSAVSATCGDPVFKFPKQGCDADAPHPSTCVSSCESCEERFGHEHFEMVRNGEDQLHALPAQKSCAPLRWKKY